MAKVSFEFRVQVNELLQKNEKVFISGSLSEFGNWYPMKARVLKRQERSKANQRCFYDFMNNNLSQTFSEIWGDDLLVPMCHIEYRYFIGVIDENESYDEKSINIVTWESHIDPRKINILDRMCNGNEEMPIDIYGRIDDHTRLLRGWLTDQTAVQVRLFGDAIKLYQTRLKSKRIFVSCHYFQMNRHHDNTDDDQQHSLKYHVAKVSKLTDGDYLPHFPPPGGIEYCQDQLTFHFETMDLEDMGIEIEIRQLTSDISRSVTPTPNPLIIENGDHSPVNGRRDSNPDDEYVLVGTARLGLMPSKRAVKSISIYNGHNRPIGEIKVDFMAVYPLMGHRYTMEKTYQMHWKHRKTLKVGHKGSGTSYGHTAKMSAVRENTIYSLKNAFQHGADYVEFDVQLSRDMIPVLYHDFKVCTVLRKKKKNDLQYLAVPVKDLSLSDLQALKLDHTSAMTDLNSKEIMDMEDIDPTDLQPFPTLQDCLEQVDAPMGFNIELKYPQQLMNGENEQSNFFDRNGYVDTILKIVAKFAKGRRLIFSCFDADVCLMLSLKQNMYPIIFLTQGDTTEYEAYKDPRTSSIRNSMYFTKSCNILGLCVFATNLAENMCLVQKILDLKLILFLWGESNNELEAQQRWVDLGVHGIIFDRIHEFQANGSQNVFVMNPPNIDCS